MKIVRQLVEYLCSRGLITWHDLLELERRGLVNATRFRYLNYEPKVDGFWEELSNAEADFPSEKEPPGRRPPGRHRPSPPKSAATTLKDIETWLRSERSQWAHNLIGLEILARLLKRSTPPWESLPQELRNTADDTLLPFLDTALRKRHLTLKALWTAIEFDSYRTPPGVWLRPAPAVRA
jgi:hypothetical protein